MKRAQPSNHCGEYELSVMAMIGVKSFIKTHVELFSTFFYRLGAH